MRIICRLQHGLRYNLREFNKRDVKMKSSASEYTLSENDVKQIIDATKSIRNKLIIELLAFTGCRRLELVLLRVMDIKVDLDMIIMPTVKQEKGAEGNRITIAYENRREIPIINSDLKRDLQAYIDVMKSKRRIIETSRLIQSRQQEAITEEMINIIVSKSAERAGIKSPNPNRKHVHPHMFRHTFVRYARKKGVDYKVIQRMVGHASIATTMDMYGEPSWEDKKGGLTR